MDKTPMPVKARLRAWRLSLQWNVMADDDFIYLDNKAIMPLDPTVIDETRPALMD
jgi:hypothetical protein